MPEPGRKLCSSRRRGGFVGEPLRVEISSKFRRAQFRREVGRAGLRLESWCADRAGDFAVALPGAARRTQANVT
jgi:hypothetical protein